MKPSIPVPLLLGLGLAVVSTQPAPAQLVVTTSADEDDGDALPGNGTGTSLREAIRYAGPGDTITFNNTLSGQTVSVTNGQILILKSLTLDASALAEAVIVDGHGRNRLLHCGSQTTNTFIDLTLTGGRIDGAGGAILNDSALTLNGCTLTGNIAHEAGAIFNFADVTLNRCTLAGNAARYGGAIECDGGSFTINNSTLAGNVATNEGGAIFNFFTVTLNHSTVVGNEAFYGGGIANCDTLHLNNSIVAGNTANVEGQIGGTVDGVSGVNLTSGDPMLASLGDYGGPTHTMPPLPGSPAIDPPGGDTNSAFPIDQRGFARLVGALVDVGAAEFQGAPDVSRFWPADWDGDGNPFGVEQALGLDPHTPDAAGAGTPAPYPPAVGNGLRFGFNPDATNFTAWVVKRSLDLSGPASFHEIYRLDGPSGITTQTNDLTVNLTADSILITDDSNPRPPASFYRLDIEPSP